jgi:hypothetical protein
MSMYGSAMFGGGRRCRRGECDLGGSNLRLLRLQFFSNMAARAEGTPSLEQQVTDIGEEDNEVG